MSHLLLHEPCIANLGVCGGFAVDVREPLKRADPESFAIEDMNHLLAESGETKAAYLARIVAFGD